MPKATFLRVFNADQGAGTASVDCPRQRKRVPVLVCEACEHCLHASRTSDTGAWALVCDAGNGS